MQGDALWVGLLVTVVAIAGVLAVTGIYGVISYAVAQRTHEIGMLLALGADALTIIKLIMRQAVVVFAADNIPEQSRRYRRDIFNDPHGPQPDTADE